MRFKNVIHFLCTLIFFISLGNNLAAQEVKKDVDHSYKPLIIKLDEEGNKYIRFITWHQIWLTTNNFENESSDFKISPSIRRSRFLTYAQISPKFLILTHWGLNGLSSSNLTTLGNNGDGPQIFLHGAWLEFMVNKHLYLGGGLHYWNGLNRLASSSTLNFMTMDQTRPFLGWHLLGYSDQFARHMGVYAKGQIGKLDYRVSVNEPIKYGFNCEASASDLKEGIACYNTNLIYQQTEGNMIISGYFRYNFWDKESTKLPYSVGTYLGKKSVFNVGAGFFAHPNGSISLKSGVGAITANPSDSNYFDELNQKTKLENVLHLSVDAFLDMPIGDGAFNAYANIIKFNYGPGYIGGVGEWSATGNAFYAHVGYLIPKSKFMPYIGYQVRHYDAFQDSERENGRSLNAGLNYFVSGHNAKLTLEYHQIKYGGNTENRLSGDVSQIRFQAHVFL